jgi:prepilin-type N-terminal cleavage/methylation domain-containing protein
VSIVDDEGGFTLIELLITIVIMGIIIAAIGASATSILHNTNATNQRLSESHDAQITSAYFSNDVQSADVTATSLDCGSIAGDSPVTKFQTTEYGVSGGTTSVVTYTVVVYSTEVVGGGSPLLRRRVCRGASAGSVNPSPVSDVILAHYLQSSGAATICAAPCAGWPPNAVVLTAVESSGYKFSVAGVRRDT